MIKNKSQILYETSSTRVIADFVLVFVAVSCTLGAIISAFDFSVDPLILFLVLIFISLAASLLSKFIGFKGLLFLFLPALIMLLLWFQDITDAAKWVVFYISNDYSTWLFVPVLFANAESTISQQTIFYSFAGILLTFPVSFAICIKRSLLLTVLFSAPIVFLAFVHQYSPPHPIFLVGLLAVYITVLFNNSIIFPGFIEKRHVVFISIILAVILSGVAYIIAPAQNYTRNRVVTSLDHHLRGFATQIGLIRTKTGIGWPYISDGIWSFDTNNVDISEAGTRVISNENLLEVVASGPGVFYLRGYSMQRFDGNSWSVNSDDLQLPGELTAKTVPFEIIEAASQTDQASTIMNINMLIIASGDMTENIEYLPYYSPAITGREIAYVIAFFHSDKSIPELYQQLDSETLPSFDLSDYSASVYSPETYLQINESTAYGLRQIAADAGFNLTADRTAIVSQVALYFSTFGQYTLSPLLIPEDEDFVLHFLQQSQHGYCIHYATAATLMLRALDIPARFTVGFVAAVSDSDISSSLELTDRNAHAWVEVFFDEYGWLPLEVTPFSIEEIGTFLGRPQAGSIPLPEPGIMGNMLGDGPFFYDVSETGNEIIQSDDQSPQRISNFLIICVVIVAGITALIIRRIIILNMRKKSFEQADTNAAVIYAWGYLIRLAGPSKQNLISKSIKEIAFKAGFSQHQLTEEERTRVVGYTYAFIDNAYQQQGQPGRFIMKYIFGL